MSVRLRRPPRQRPSYDGAPPDAGPSRRRRATPIAFAAAALAAGGAGAAALFEGDEQSDRPGVRAAGRAAPVTRQTLVARETVEGTLGYAGTRTVLNRLATAGGGSGGETPGAMTEARSNDGGADPSSPEGSGTVTALPRPGSVVRRGGTLYRLDSEPVVLMYGATPAYRDLELGVEDGRDVRQLERNLAALGFDPGTIDTEFTSTTAAAVTDWQESAGLPETGAVELGRVVFLPGARRIGEHRTSAGAALSAGSEVLDTSSTRRVVTIELDAALQSLARKGDRVKVTLPDQSTVRGRIADVGRVAREKESADAADPGAGAEQELVIDVTVRLSSKRGLGRLDEAPVSVGLAQESRKNVLAVPVEALVARRGGGYGVELAAGRRIVPVETGLFAGGYVEVSGSAIREGTRVVVPDA
jgi:peptidoglycan hydrolase-like protein with peptidoglycan-binding domain